MCTHQAHTGSFLTRRGKWNPTILGSIQHMCLMCAHTIFIFFVQLAHIHMSLVSIRFFVLMFGIKDTWFPMFVLQEISALEILVDFHLRNWIFLVRNFDQHEISPKSRFRNLKLISALRHIFRTYLYIFIKLYMMCTHQAQNIWKRIFENLINVFLLFFVFLRFLR